MYGPEKNNEVPLDDKQQEDAANAADAPARLLATSQFIYVAQQSISDLGQSFSLHRSSSPL